MMSEMAAKEPSRRGDLVCRRDPPCWDDVKNGYEVVSLPDSCCCNCSQPSHCGLWSFTKCKWNIIKGCKCEHS